MSESFSNDSIQREFQPKSLKDFLSVGSEYISAILHWLRPIVRTEVSYKVFRNFQMSQMLTSVQIVSI
jgi:hypothetical protein